MTNQPKQDEWLTPGDAAAVLGVGVRTLSRLADAGEVRAIRPNGGHRRYSEASLEALLARTANWESA